MSGEIFGHNSVEILVFPKSKLVTPSVSKWKLRLVKFFSNFAKRTRMLSKKKCKNNVNVVANELPSQITIYTCSTIDIWTWWRRRTSTQFYALQCHPPRMVCFQRNWCQKFTLLWTPLAHRKALSESYATHAFLC